MKKLPIWKRNKIENALNKPLKKHRIQQLIEESNINQEDLAYFLGYQSKGSVSKLQYKDVEEISSKDLIKLSRIFDVSVDYILGLSDDYTHVGNKEIHSLTGLSNKSIEVLREIENGNYENMDEIVGNDYESGLSFEITELINMVLEKSEVRFYVGGKTIFNLFSLLYEYITNSSAVDDFETYQSSVASDLQKWKDIQTKYSNENISEENRQFIQNHVNDLEKQLKNENDKIIRSGVDASLIKHTKFDGSEDYLFTQDLYRQHLKSEIEHLLEEYRKSSDNESLEMKETVENIENTIREFKKGIPFFEYKNR